MRKLTIAITFLLAIPASQMSFAKPPTSMAPMLKEVMPGVVNIAVRGFLPPSQLPPGAHPKARAPAGMIPKFEDLGTGVIVDAEEGYIVTNAHVIKNANVVTVTLRDGRRLRARVIGQDNASDLAVIQVHAEHLTAIPYGDSDALKVGDFVAAIGYPFGLQQTVTSGVISGLERGHMGIEHFGNFIQTDAPINPGNSGGALVDMQGKLIGINTAIITASPLSGNVGIGLAIPSDLVKSVMNQLIQYGRVERGLLGVVVQNITPALAETMKLPNTKGALVAQVNPDSPADRAGLKAQDVIISLDGKPVRSAFQVSTNVGLLRIGTRIALDILRNGKSKVLHAVIADPMKQRKSTTQKQKSLLFGLQIRDYDQLASGQELKGVEVLYVDDTSFAYSSGLRPGDVILAAANQPIGNIDEFKAIAEKHPKQMLLKIKHFRGGNIFIVLEG